MAHGHFDPGDATRRAQIEQQPTRKMPAAGMPVEQQPTVMMPTMHSSRRNFLKAAVVASAGVAAAGGAAGAALLTGELPSPSISFVGRAVSGDPCRGCITGSNYVTYTTFTINGNGKNNTPGTFFLWFTDHVPPTGQYDITVQIKVYAVNSNTTVTATYNLGDAAAPFIYKPDGAHAFIMCNAKDCPIGSPDGQFAQAGTLAGLLPIHWTQPPHGTNDLQVYAHLDWWGHTISAHSGDTQRFDFVIAFKNHATGATLCTETVTLKGQQA